MATRRTRYMDHFALMVGELASATVIFILDHSRWYWRLAVLLLMLKAFSSLARGVRAARAEQAGGPNPE